MEPLAVLPLDSIIPIFVSIDDQLDHEFNLRLYLQCQVFLNNSDSGDGMTCLCPVNRQIAAMPIYCRIGGQGF